MAIVAAGDSSVIAGAYKATWNGLEIGDITPDGYELSWRNTSEGIFSDLAGAGTKLDDIYQGTSCMISFTVEHWNAHAIEQMVWWMGNQVDPTNYSFGTVQAAGLRHWDAAKTLVLESCALDDMGVLPATAANQTIDPLDITFPKTLLSNEQAVSMVLSSRPRYIPIVLEIFPVRPPATPADFEDPSLIKRPTGCAGVVFWQATRNETQPTPKALALAP